jgi:hypothetical protein
VTTYHPASPGDLTYIAPRLISNNLKKIIMLFKRKCCFCKKKKPPVAVMIREGTYNLRRLAYHYHPACLLKVAANPEKYGHRMADKAIAIFDLKKEIKKQENEKFTETQKSYTEIRKHLANILTMNDEYQKEYEKINGDNQGKFIKKGKS